MTESKWTEQYNYTTNTLTKTFCGDAPKSLSEGQIYIPSVLCVTLVPVCFLILGVIMVAFIYKHYTYLHDKWIAFCREEKSCSAKTLIRPLRASIPANLQSARSSSPRNGGNAFESSDISTEVQIGSSLSVSDYSPIRFSSPLPHFDNHHQYYHHHHHPERLHCNTPVSWSESIESNCYEPFSTSYAPLLSLNVSPPIRNNTANGNSTTSSKSTAATHVSLEWDNFLPENTVANTHGRPYLKSREHWV